MPDKVTLAAIVVVAMAFLLVPAGSAQAGTITVGPGGGYDFTSIQAAIYAAGTGDTVIVYPHTYYENIDFLGKAITVRSSNPNNLNIVRSTIIDGGGLDSVVRFVWGVGADSVLEGLTITNGSAPYGGGIYGAGSSATIKKCFIINNIAEYGGGGIYWCTGAILNCTIVGNSAKDGGGLAVCSGIIRNCNIIENSGSWLYGGTYFCGGRISNCIFWGNQPPDNIDYNRSLPTYSCIQHFVGVSNMSEDPLFVNPGAMDYRLQPDSPCINGGDPNLVPEPGETDIDGDPRVLFGRVDIGADEFNGNLRPVANAGPDQSFSDIPALITLNGRGSLDDNGDALAYHWQRSAGPHVDLDDSNAVGPSFVPQEHGGYVFELVVSDGVLDSFADTVFVVVGSGRVPVADAGLPRYAADQLTVETSGGRVSVNDYVVLDGTGSYDPDSSGPLSYDWRQISGPSLNVTGRNTATPTISGFTQTSAVQVCEFELVVSDGDYNSPPDIAEVLIVRAPGPTNNMVLENDSGVFNPDKPTTIYFAGSGDPWSQGDWDDTEWQSLANVISFSEYEPDYAEYSHTYGRVSDMIITYLSSEAPDYRLPIQVMGGSAGVHPTTPVALYLNKYKDPRYNANHVSLFDGAWEGMELLVGEFVASRVDGEQAWVDNCDSLMQHMYCVPGVLAVNFDIEDHSLPQAWYRETTDPSLTPFNSGIVGGAYWSVFGPGKNLQLAWTPDTCTYDFKWYGDHTSGYLVLYEDCTVCGKLPEPVTLINPVAGGTTDPNPAPGPLTCEESENAVGYQLLFGSDPYRVAHYIVVSDTPAPPTQVITTFPFEKTYWTIKVRDQYGSTIYADPLYIDAFLLTRPVKNLNTGKWYGYIQHAINDANSGDEIVAKAGVYYETVDFGGKNVTLRSTAPDDRDTIAATVIKGNGRQPVVSFCNAEDAGCLLSGFTITDGNQAIYCNGGCPTVTNCNIVGNAGAGIQWRTSLACRYPIVANCIVAGNGGPGMDFQERGNPSIINCVISGNLGNGIYARSPWMTNCTVVGNKLWGVTGVGGKVANCIIRDNAAGAIESSPLVSYSNIEGGCEAQGNVDVDPCFVVNGYWDAEVWVEGDYHLRYSSPCVDSGDNNTVPSDTADLDGDGNTTEPMPWDLDGRDRLADGDCNDTDIVDMGAYEFAYAYIGDFDGQCDVDFDDYAILASQWQKAPGLPSADIAPDDGDGIVDWLDLKALCDNWLAGVE